MTEINDTHAVPAHDDTDRDLCADENCSTCATPVGEPASPTTDIHDHPAYGVIDDVFADSSNVVEFVADAGAVGMCGAVGDPGCIRLGAAGSGLVEAGAASIHLDPATARQLLGELAEVAAPAKTHDLAVHTVRDGIRIVVDDETDDWRLHLSPGSAKVLGKMLGFLTPAQVAILAEALTGGAL